LKPAGVKDHLAGKGNENDQQDKPAAAARAGSALPEAKSFLKPIK